MGFWKKEAGLAMPLVLVVMVVLTLLGGALWQYSIFQLERSVRNEKQTRAYYMARSGAEAVALDLMRNPEKLESMVVTVGEISTAEGQTFRTGQSGDVGWMEVELERLSEFSLQISGIGTVDTVQERVSIIMEALEPFDGVVYSAGGLKFQNQVDLSGNVVSGGDVYLQNSLMVVHPNADDGYTVTHGKEMVFPDPEFPAPPESYRAEPLNVNAELTISADKNPPDPNLGESKININSGGELTIDAVPGPVTVFAGQFEMAQQNSKLVLNTHNENDLQLVVDNGMVLRTIRVTGEGIAKIYVREGTVDATTPNSDILDAGAHLVLFLGDGAKLVVQASGPRGYFQGLVYGPKAIVELQGNANFEGSMIVGQLKGKGDMAQADKVHESYDWSILDDIFGRYRMIQWVQ